MNTYASLLYRVKRNQVKMMLDRGYDARQEQEALKAQSFDEFQKLLKQKGLSALNARYTGEDTAHVYYVHAARQLGKSVFFDIFSEYGEDVSHVIIVTSSPLSSEAKNFVEMEKSKRFFEVFLYRDLCYDPTAHYLTPKHRLLRGEQAQKVLEENRLHFVHLPIISVDDPIARWYGARPGDVMQIERKNLISEVSMKDLTVFRAVRALQNL